MHYQETNYNESDFYSRIQGYKETNNQVHVYDIGVGTCGSDIFTLIEQ